MKSSKEKKRKRKPRRRFSVVRDRLQFGRVIQETRNFAHLMDHQGQLITNQLHLINYDDKIEDPDSDMLVAPFVKSPSMVPGSITNVAKWRGRYWTRITIANPFFGPYGNWLSKRVDAAEDDYGYWSLLIPYKFVEEYSGVYYASLVPLGLVGGKLLLQKELNWELYGEYLSNIVTTIRSKMLDAKYLSCCTDTDLERQAHLLRLSKRIGIDCSAALREYDSQVNGVKRATKEIVSDLP